MAEVVEVVEVVEVGVNEAVLHSHRAFLALQFVHTIPTVSIFSEGEAFRMNRTLHSEQGRLHAYEMMTHTHVAQQIDNINPSVMKFFRSLMPGGSLLRFGYL